MDMPDLYTEEQLKELTRVQAVSRFEEAVREYLACLRSGGGLAMGEKTERWNEIVRQLEEELNRRLKMLELLPDFLREILEIAAKGEFKEGDSEHLINEGEKDLGEMSAWEKACLCRAAVLERKFQEDNSKKSALNYARIGALTIFNFSTEERLPAAKNIVPRGNWRLAEWE